MLSRDAALAGRRRALVAPCTTRFRGLPSDVDLDPTTDPVPRACVANLDAVEQVSVALLTERVGALSPTRMRQMCDALSVAVGCI